MKTKFFHLLLATFITQLSYAQVGCMFIDSMQKFNEGSSNFASTLPTEARMGTDIENLGDLDGDGIDDIAIGAHQDGTGGALYIVFMNANGSIKNYQKINTTLGNFQGSYGNGDGFGTSVANIGDYSGDGINDIIVGAPFADSWDGKFWLLEMDTNGTVKSTHELTDSLGINHTDDNLASTLASIGDINGDGINDFAIGAKRNSSGGSETGAVHIVMMDTNYSVKSVKTLSNSSGGMNNQIQSGSFFGDGLSGIGDLNNDGVNDVAVGARHDNSGATKAGAAYIIFLDTAGNAINHVKFSGGSGGNLSGLLSAQDRFGASVSGERDINGDGVNDIMIGAIRDDDGGTDKGALYCFYMNPNGTFKEYFKLSQLTPNFNLTLGASDYFGRSSTFFGSSNTNNSMKIVVTANLDNTGGTDKGAFYFIELENYLPLEIIPSDTVVCAGDSISLTSAGYANSFWLGGVQNGAWFTPTATDTYSVYMIDPFGCSDTTDQIVKVNPIPTFTASTTPSFCENQSIVSLTHISPSGGVYSGPGIVNQNQFNPLGLVGSNVISYSFTDTLSCSNFMLDTITVYNVPQVQLQTQAPLCDNDPSSVLSGTPSGGQFTGAGVQGAAFNPVLAGAGVHTVSYTYQNSGGCSGTDSIDITVQPSSALTVNNSVIICEVNGSAPLNHISPQGGIYSGAGVNNNTFFATGSGSFPVSYTFTNPLGCTTSINDTIDVSQGPTAQLEPIGDICAHDTAIVLIASPAGGSFVGNTVTNGVYTPGAGSFGNENIQYIASDSVGCLDTASITFVVDTVPQLTMSNDTIVCRGATITLEAYGADGILWNSGETSNTITVVEDYTTMHFVLGTTSVGLCSIWDTIHVTVNDPQPNLGPDFNAYVDSLVTVNAPVGYNYMWHDGQTTQSWNGTFSGSGVYPISVVITDSLGCTGNDTVNAVIRINSLDEIEADWLKVYPNPSSTFVTIESDLSKSTQVRIFSATGALIQSFELQAVSQQIIDVSELASGSYFISISNEDQVIQKQLLKQ